MSKLRLLTAAAAVPAVAPLALGQLPGSPAGGLPPVSGVPLFSAPPAAAAAPFPAAAPIAGVGTPVGIAPSPPLPTSPTLWSFLGLSRAQREFRQRAAADTPFGELRSRIRQPLSDATGGLIPPIPPDTPALAELLDPGPVGAAAKVKLDRAAAKKRIKAVQYLGTVDCHYWPEAEDALVAALRADRNEWVRLAAAQTLLKGCCCTKKTILALTMAATCSNADGNPAEKSPRVAAAAQAALSKCLEGLCASPVILADPGVPVEQQQEQQQERRGEGERAAVAKPGPAGAEKGAGGLAPDQIAPPSPQEVYVRAAARPWGEMIAFSRAHLAKAPPVPVEYLQAALVEVDAGPAEADDGGADAAPAAVARRERPANLYDALFGDTNTAKAPAPPRQPVTMPAMPAAPVVAAAAPPPARVSSALSAAPARVVMAPPSRPAPPPTPAPVVPVAAPAPVTPAAAPVVAKPVAPARMPEPVARPTMAPARSAMTPAAERAVGAVAGGDATAIRAAVELLAAADVSASGPLPMALLKSAEDHADPAARTACVRALARCRADSPAVRAGLERLVGDRTVDVRVEAAVALNELKGK